MIHLAEKFNHTYKPDYIKYRLRTQQDVKLAGDDNMLANSEYIDSMPVFTVFSKTGLDQIFRGSDILCLGASPAIEQYWNKIRHINNKVYVFAPLQMYEALIKQRIRVDCVFSVETHPMHKINDNLFADWFYTCDEHPPKYYLSPLSTDPLIFNMPCKNRFSYITANYKYSESMAARTGQPVFPGGCAVTVHMLQMALLLECKSVTVLGYDFCFRDILNQRVRGSGDALFGDIFEVLDYFKNPVYTNATYNRAFTDICNTLEICDMAGIDLNRVKWASNGLVPVILSNPYISFDTIVQRFRANAHVKPLPDIAMGHKVSASEILQQA